MFYHLCSLRGPIFRCSLLRVQQTWQTELKLQIVTKFISANRVMCNNYVCLFTKMARGGKHGRGQKRKHGNGKHNNLDKKQKTHFKQFGERHPADDR